MNHRGLKFLLLLLHFLILVNINALLQQKFTRKNAFFLQRRNRTGSSSCFLSAGSFFSCVFPLHTYNENTSRHGWKRALRASAFVWAYSTASPHFSKHWLQGLQFSLAFSHRVSSTHWVLVKRSLAIGRDIFLVCLHINCYFHSVFV